MRFLLDTNVLIAAQRGYPGSVGAHLRELSPDDVCIAVVSIAELWYGAARHPDPDRRRALWSEYLAPYAVLPFDRAAAERHGDLRQQLRHTPIGERDLLVAAIALANDLTVVTGNTREFGRVPGLQVVDWSTAG